MRIDHTGRVPQDRDDLLQPECRVLMWERLEAEETGMEAGMIVGKHRGLQCIQIPNIQKAKHTLLQQSLELF